MKFLGLIVILLSNLWLSSFILCAQDIFIDEDSSGQRCILAFIVDAKPDHLLNQRVIIYFTLKNEKPLRTEFALKFPTSSTPPIDPFLEFQTRSYKVIYRNDFGWLEKASDDKTFLDDILKSNSFELTYKRMGRSYRYKIPTQPFVSVINQLPIECKFLA